MNIKQLAETLENLNQPGYRIKQIKKAIYQDGMACFSDISSLPKNLREKLDQNIQIFSFQADEILISQDQRSAKAALRLADGAVIETVLISPKPGTWSVCISSQVGCPLGCDFCATGKAGFGRNLTAEEITDQVLFWKFSDRSTPTGKLPTDRNISNIVYMGMGEPFLNWENVKESLQMFLDPELFGFGARSISVSTAGIPDGIRNLAQDFPQVNLAISLHFADEAKRTQSMPINKKYNLVVLKESLQQYFQKTQRKVFLEYILLAGINDAMADAEKLVDWVSSIGHRQLLHVNLIRYNTTDERLKPSNKEKTLQFKNFLMKNHVPVTIRKSLGQDIQGACGQLAGDKKQG